MSRFVVDVHLSTHDALKDGILTLDWHRVVLDARNGMDAENIAYLMCQSQGWYPTSVTVIDWDE